jgi:hypothetical protein
MHNTHVDQQIYFFLGRDDRICAPTHPTLRSLQHVELLQREVWLEEGILAKDVQGEAHKREHAFVV